MAIRRYGSFTRSRLRQTTSAEGTLPARLHRGSDRPARYPTLPNVSQEPILTAEPAYIIQPQRGQATLRQFCRFSPPELADSAHLRDLHTGGCFHAASQSPCPGRQYCAAGSLAMRIARHPSQGQRADVSHDWRARSTSLASLPPGIFLRQTDPALAS